MIHGYLANNVDLVCRPLLLGKVSVGGDSIRITASVGINGVNLFADVRTIQQALNDVPPDQGRPTPLLTVDGFCEDKTKKAIQMFQLKHFGWKGADGRVDPDKQTIAKLNELINRPGSSAFALASGAVQPSNTPGKLGRVARITSLLGQTQTIIKAARGNLQLALNVVDTVDPPGIPPSFSRSERMRLVNRHFDVDKYPKSVRRTVLMKLLKIYDTMLSVFARPGGLWGPAIFDLDPFNAPVLAYTTAGGYYYPGEKDIDNLRTDTIFLCDKLDAKTDEACEYTIIHELAHFVGFPEYILDHAYGWYDYTEMQRLTPYQKLFSADCYSNFAFDSAKGRKAKGTWP